MSKRYCILSMFLPFLAVAEESSKAVSAESAVPAENTLWDIVYGGSVVNLLIWGAIGVTSFLMLTFALNALLQVREEKLLPSSLEAGINFALRSGDVNEVLRICSVNDCAFSTIVTAAFSHIRDGYDVIQQAVVQSIDMESENLMQRIGRLNICGQIAPMFGLMGTVVGMVLAFSGLATSSGAAKTRILANSISTALWTTCVGLLIAVPALLLYTYFKNKGTRLLMQLETRVLELVKLLRHVEVSE